MSLLLRRNISMIIVFVVFILLVFKHIRVETNLRRILNTRNNSTYHAKQASTGVVSRRKRGEMKTIQWFDTYHDGHGLRMKAHNVKMKKCEYKNCKLLEQKIVPVRNNVVYGPLDADAVIFQGCHLGQILPPVRRDDDQVFVFAERETWWYMGAFERMMDPALNKSEKLNNDKSLSMRMPDVWKHPGKFINIFRFRSLFNWTMTYRRDSDIYLPYGEIIPNQGALRQGLTTRHEIKLRLGKDYDRLYYTKSKDVVWLVSDCNTKSKREYYVQRLKKYINVDIYGECGNLTCPKEKYRDSDKHSCMYKIVSQYKFVLSFENTFHTDYVTEKLFDWFPRNIIQVVYGMANYDVIAPPGTVINAANFNSPKELAHFLKNIGDDKNKYIKYLKNKSKYYSANIDQMQQAAYCNLCKKLNHLEENRRSYQNIGLWWQLNNTLAFRHLYLQAFGIHESRKSKYFIFTFYLIAFTCIFMLFSLTCSYFKEGRKHHFRTVLRQHV